jgi:hypothetical protein
MQTVQLTPTARAALSMPGKKTGVLSVSESSHISLYVLGNKTPQSVVQTGRPGDASLIPDRGKRFTVRAFIAVLSTAALRDVPADAGFLCDKAPVVGEEI